MSNTFIHTKKFELYITQAQIKQRIEAIAEEINRQYAEKQPIILVVLKGAFRFAADLIEKLNFPLEIEFVRLASYEGTESSGKILAQDLGLSNLSHRTVIVVEDIIDTGNTYQYIEAKLQTLQVASSMMITLLFKPNKYQFEKKPEFIGFEIPDDFVVGYGLDYDGLGRELNDIYTLKEE